MKKLIFIVCGMGVSALLFGQEMKGMDMSKKDTSKQIVAAP